MGKGCLQDFSVYYRKAYIIILRKTKTKGVNVKENKYFEVVLMGLYVASNGRIQAPGRPGFRKRQDGFPEILAGTEEGSRRIAWVAFERNLEEASTCIIKIGGSISSDYNVMWEVAQDLRKFAARKQKKVIQVVSAMQGMTDFLTKRAEDESVTTQLQQSLPDIEIDLSKGTEQYNLFVASGEIIAAILYGSNNEKAKIILPPLNEEQKKLLIAIVRQEMPIFESRRQLKKPEKMKREPVDVVTDFIKRTDFSQFRPFWPVHMNNELMQEDEKKIKVAVEAMHGSEENVIVLPGFIAIDEEGKFRILERGGTDTVAGLILEYIENSMLLLVKDTGGVFTADPKVVDNPKLFVNADAVLVGAASQGLHPGFPIIADHAMPALMDALLSSRRIAVCSMSALKPTHADKQVTLLEGDLEKQELERPMRLQNLGYVGFDGNLTQYLGYGLYVFGAKMDHTRYELNTYGPNSGQQNRDVVMLSLPSTGISNRRMAKIICDIIGAEVPIYGLDANRFEVVISAPSQHAQKIYAILEGARYLRGPGEWTSEYKFKGTYQVSPPHLNVAYVTLEASRGDMLKQVVSELRSVCLPTHMRGGHLSVDLFFPAPTMLNGLSKEITQAVHDTLNPLGSPPQAIIGRKRAPREFILQIGEQDENSINGLRAASEIYGSQIGQRDIKPGNVSIRGSTVSIFVSEEAEAAIRRVLEEIGLRGIEFEERSGLG